MALSRSMALLMFAWRVGIWLGSPVLADGKGFPLHAEAMDVRIPDQRALLWWTNGVERLVIETRFTGGYYFRTMNDATPGHRFAVAIRGPRALGSLS